MMYGTHHRDAIGQIPSKTMESDGEVMSLAKREVITIRPTNTIMNGVKTMMNAGFRRLPIVNSGIYRLVGIITCVDIVNFLGGGPKHNLVSEKHNSNFYAAINDPVSEIMEQDVITISHQASVEDACSLMSEKAIGVLPIVDSKNLLRGIISEKDFLPLVSRIPFDISVSQCISNKLITVLPNTTIEEASKIIVKNRIRRLPVVKNNIFLGMVTSTDLVRFLSSGQMFDELITGDVHDALSLPVKQIMYRDVPIVNSEDLLKKAAGIMMESERGGIPAMKGDRLIGMITEQDLVRMISKHGILYS